MTTTLSRSVGDLDRSLWRGIGAFLAVGLAGCAVAALLVRQAPEGLQLPLALGFGVGLVVLGALVLELTARAVSRTARLAEERLDTMLESMTDIFLAVTPEGEVLRANPAALRFITAPGAVPGKERPDVQPMLRRHDVRFLDGTPLDWDRWIHTAVQDGAVPRSTRLRMRDASGAERMFHVSISALPSSGGRSPEVLLFVGRDLTDVQRLERLRDEFLAVAAHELKTPAATVKGYAQLLEQWTPGGHTEREGRAFRVLRRQGDRLARLVDELLEVSRLELGQTRVAPTRVALSVLLPRWVESLRGLSDRHTLVLELPERPLYVRADTGRLEHVISNLVDNAVKYSPAGGEVRLEVRADDDEVFIRVIDRGMGIPAERQARIFERYFRAHAGRDDDRGGLGVGLHISRALIERMGGRMGFSSREGQGSTFWVRLPRLGARTGEEVGSDAIIGAPH